MGDIVELWARRRETGRRALMLRGARDVAGLLLHFGRGYPVTKAPLMMRVLMGGTTVLHDIRYSFRLMRRQPLFAALTLATLTLGIAASTGIFTTVDRLLWRPLPFPDPDRLVIVAHPPYSFAGNRMNPSDALTALPAFAGVGLYAQGGVNVDGLGTPVRAAAAVASPGFFTALRVPAIVGRPYTREEDIPGANAVVVVSHRFWLSRLGGDPNVLERALSINRRPFRITAVMPEGFTFPGLTELWLPSAADRQTTGQGFAPTVVARLAPAVTAPEAEAALDALDRERGAPEREKSGPRLTRLQDALTRDVRPTLLLLAMSVGLVLLVAATNVAGLLLARVARRQPEYVMRRALGASRRRLIQLMAVDALCYATLAGVAGAALGTMTLRAFSALSGGLGAATTPDGVDTRMLLIAFCASASSALLFGLAPGVAAAAHPASQALRSGVTSTRGRGWRWVRSTLVVSQVAGALVLLAVTSATTATMQRLAAVDLAFDGRGVLGLDVTLPTATYGGPRPASLFVERALERLHSIPGVTSAGATGLLPGDASTGIGIRVNLPGEVLAPGAEPRFASFLSASPEYFDALGIKVVSGRAFTEDDRPGAPAVVIISESTARLLWPDGRSPVGLRVETGFTAMAAMEVVGVVRDVMLRGPDALTRPAHLYRPMAQYPPFGNVSFAVKTSGDPLALGPAVTSAIAEIDPTLPVYHLRSMARVASDFLAAHRLALTVMGLFAILTMTLAGVGLYGVLAQLVEQQTREIGVRVALGAEPRQVRRAVVSVALKLAACGVVIGAAASGVAASLVASYVPRLDAISWPTVAGLAGLLMVIALVASWVPARRASAIDPIVALRD
jgi:predicted permease